LREREHFREEKTLYDYWGRAPLGGKLRRDKGARPVRCRTVCQIKKVKGRKKKPAKPRRSAQEKKGKKGTFLTFRKGKEREKKRRATISLSLVGKKEEETAAFSFASGGGKGKSLVRGRGDDNARPPKGGKKGGENVQALFHNVREK